MFYIDDIPLSINEMTLSNHFEMKDLDNTSFVWSIQIYRNCSKGIYALFYKLYIMKVLNIFNMHIYAPSDTLITKVISLTCINVWS